MTQPQPRAWLDKNYVPCFRADVPLEEASELQDMLGDAFVAGVRDGYKQALASRHHNVRRMLQALDAYWLHCDGLPKGRYPRGSYEAEDWWTRFEKYRAFVDWQLLEDE